MADFLPYLSEMIPAPKVPTANPAKNNIFATTEINRKFLGNVKRQVNCTELTGVIDRYM